MKVYISADIEGVAGIAAWSEANSGTPFADEMQREVQAACEGANEAGVTEILVVDAHDTGRNLSFANLPTNVKLVRSFNGHPYSMMQELDNSFTAALMIGYHSYAGSNYNPLAHTLSTSFFYIKINGEYASEFLINAYTASLVGVPVSFISGDSGLCQHVQEINPAIHSLGVSRGVGDSVISLHPDQVFQKIKTEVACSLRGDLNKYHIPLPKIFTVEIAYIHHTQAYKASFYPGMKKLSPRNLLFETDDYFDVLRMLSFV